MKWLAELLEEYPMECYLIACLLAVGLMLLVAMPAPDGPDCDGTYARVRTDGTWECHDTLEEFEKGS